MKPCAARLVLCAALAAVLSVANLATAEMGGGEARPTPFVGDLQLGDGNCRFSIDVDRLALQITTVAGKYRLVRLLVNCRDGDKLALSATNDRLQMLLPNNGRATALLSLRQADPAIWDAFDANLKRTLLYPAEVAPGAPVYVFGYFPIAEVTSLPIGFELSIASRGETVELMNLAAAARN